MHQPEPDILQGALLIARHRHPTATLTDVTDRLDDIAEQLIPKLPESRYPMKIISTMSQHLYNELGFQGATDYYLPENSCINFVMSERQGIPITLALVYMEVAKRVGFDVYGVNVPGRFYLTPADPDLEFLIDPFDLGSVAFLDDVSVTLESIYGRPIKLQSAAIFQKKEQIASRVFLARMLNNLKAIYATKKDYAAALQMSQYLRATRPGDLEEVREMGFILFHLKRFQECAAALIEYLERAPHDASDAPKVRKILQKIRGVMDGTDIIVLSSSEEEDDDEDGGGGGGGYRE